jgi:hypothetical protein
MIRHIIRIHDRLVVGIRNGKEYFQSHKKDNQAHSDDGDNGPFYSRHHVPLSCSETASLQAATHLMKRTLVLGEEQPDHVDP